MPADSAVWPALPRLDALQAPGHACISTLDTGIEGQPCLHRRTRGKASSGVRRHTALHCCGSSMLTSTRWLARWFNPVPAACAWILISPVTNLPLAFNGIWPERNSSLPARTARVPWRITSLRLPRTAAGPPSNSANSGIGVVPDAHRETPGVRCNVYQVTASALVQQGRREECALQP